MAMDNAQDPNPDILIAGAGPTGLFAALLLTRAGMRVRIVDKNQHPATESRALVLQARTLELFLLLDIVEPFLTEGVIAPGLKLFVNGHLAAMMNLTNTGADDSPYPFALMLPQSTIEKLLLAELTKLNITVERGTEVVSFSEQADGVSVTLHTTDSMQHILQATYLLGADGAHSAVRDGLGLAFEGAAYQQNFMLADCEVEWPLDYTFIKLFLHSNRLSVFMPIHGKPCSRIIAIDKPVTASDNPIANVATTAEPLELPEIQSALQAAADLPVTLSQPVWVSRYRIHHRSVNHYRQGRVFVAGDAAHIHSPAGGQGMNTGLQDVANLAWKLALRVKNHSEDHLLDTYHAERWPVGKKLLQFTDKLFAGMSTQSQWRACLRNILAPLIIKLISHIPACRLRAFRFISQLGIRYHENPFLHDDITQKGHRAPKSLRPGYRAPNAIYQRNRDVFGLIGGYTFNLLILSRKALTDADINTLQTASLTLPSSLGLPLQTHLIAYTDAPQASDFLRAESNDIFNRYGVTDQFPEGLFLIRPDGYIAYRSDSFQWEKLKKFCELFAS